MALAQDLKERGTFVVAKKGEGVGKGSKVVAMADRAGLPVLAGRGDPSGNPAASGPPIRVGLG